MVADHLCYVKRR